MKHKETVYNIVKEFEPIRTEKVNLRGLYKGLAESSRYLRHLQEEGKIKGKFIGKDRTKTWTIERSVKYPQYKKQEPLKAERRFEKLLTVDTIRKDRGKINEILA